MRYETNVYIRREVLGIQQTTKSWTVILRLFEMILNQWPCLQDEVVSVTKNVQGITSKNLFLRLKDCWKKVRPHVNEAFETLYRKNLSCGEAEWSVYRYGQALVKCLENVVLWSLRISFDIYNFIPIGPEEVISNSDLFFDFQFHRRFGRVDGSVWIWMWRMWVNS